MFGLHFQPQFGANLRADHAADQQGNGQHHIHCLTFDCVHHGGECGDKDDLEQRCSDHHLGWHPQNIDHRRHHDEPATNAHNGRQNPDDQAGGDRGDDADIQARSTKTGFERQFLQARMAALDFAGFVAFGAAHGVQAFHQHQTTDQPQKQHIAKVHHQFDLTEAFQPREHLYPQRGPDKTASQQDQTHFQVNRFAFEMRQHAGQRRGNDLVRASGHGHSGRDTDEEQERCEDKPAAHAEHARQDADHAAKAQQQVKAHRNFGYGKVDLHFDRPRGVRIALYARLAGKARENIFILVNVIARKQGRGIAGLPYWMLLHDGGKAVGGDKILQPA